MPITDHSERKAVQLHLLMTDPARFDHEAHCGAAWPHRDRLCVPWVLPSDDGPVVHVRDWVAFLRDRGLAYY